MEDQSSAQAPAAARILPVGLNRWLKLLWFSGGVLAFWYVQYAYQYFILVPGERPIGLVRSFGLSGATLISLSLLTSVAFKFWPRGAVHWRLRRHLGVAGFVLIALHVLTAVKSYFNYDFSMIFFSWNPLVNPLVFGTVAFPVFFLMAATSTDWAQRHLKKWWKRLHRLVYGAMFATVFHFMTVNPPALKNYAGYLLIVLTVVTLLGQLYWFIILGSRKKFRSAGAVAGWLLILLAAVYFILRARQV